MEKIDKFINSLSKEYYLYIKKLYKESDSMINFQKKLLSITEWNQGTIEKKYKKYFKTEELFKDAVDSICQLVELVYIDTNPAKNKSKEEFIVFWNKCLRKISKFYYNNTKLLYDKSDFNKSITEIQYIIQRRFHKVTNISSIIKYHLEKTYSINNIHDISENDKIFYINPEDFCEENSNEILKLIH